MGWKRGLASTLAQPLPLGFESRLVALIAGRAITAGQKLVEAAATAASQYRF